MDAYAIDTFIVAAKTRQWDREKSPASTRHSRDHLVREHTPRLLVFSEIEYYTKSHWEIRAGTIYAITRHFSLNSQWHSQFG